MRNWFASNVPDLLIGSGGALIAYGAWLIYPAAGFIVGGGMLLGLGVIGARRHG